MKTIPTTKYSVIAMPSNLQWDRDLVDAVVLSPSLGHTNASSSIDYFNCERSTVVGMDFNAFDTVDGSYTRHQRVKDEAWKFMQRQQLWQDLFLVGITCMVLAAAAAAAVVTDPKRPGSSSTPKIVPFLLAGVVRKWYMCLLVIFMTLSLYFPEVNAQTLFSFFGNLIANVSASYMAYLDDHPLATKCVTTAFMQVLGDTVAQWNEEQTRRQCQQRQAKKATTSEATSRNSAVLSSWYDKRRGISAFVDGLLVSGPLMHFCFEALEDWIPTTEDNDMAALQDAPSTTAALAAFPLVDYMARALLSPASLACLAHVAVNDILIDAVFIAITFVVTGVGEGCGKQIIPQFRADYFAAVKASWMVSAVMVPFEFLIFRFLPKSLRTLGMNCVDIYWEALVSFMVHRHRKKEVSPMVSSSDR